MLETEKVYQAGNTVRLECTFKDFNGIIVSPQTVKVIFYDYRYNILQQLNLDTSYQLENGVYFYNYTTPSDKEYRIIYEWQGVINGVSSLKRGSFRTVFI
jgi:hypothetical protein